MTRITLIRNISALPETQSAQHCATGGKLKFRSKVLWLLTTTICVLPIGAAASHADAAPLDEAVDQALGGARALQERVAAKDLTGAKKAWISARAGWERSEIFTGGFVPDLEHKIN